MTKSRRVTAAVAGLLLAVAAPLWVLGWLAGKTAVGLVAVIAWCTAVVKLGWTDAHRPVGGA